MNRKILVTGGLGHIGSSLIKQIPLDCDLTIVDNLSTQRYCSLFNIGRPFTFLEKDFSDLTLEELDVDCVIHLAAKTDAASSVNSPAETYYNNVVKTKKLIDKVKSLDLHFIFPSSTSVYGTATDEVFEDCDSYINPQSPYAESKIEVERYIQSNLPGGYTIFRFGTICGVSPGMRFHTSINKMCYQASTNQELTVWEDCVNLSRPYLCLPDCISALLEAMYWESDEVVGDIWNILTDNVKFQYILSTIQEFCKNKLRIKYVDTPLLNQFSYNVNFDKSSGFFKPTCSVRKEIKKTIRLFISENIS